MTVTIDGSNLNTIGVINSKTAVATTSGTAIDFTGIPAGVKRITVMLNGVSTNGVSNFQIQLGAGSVITSGYVSGWSQASSAGAPVTTGFLINAAVAAAHAYSGSAVLTLLSGNTWVCSSVICCVTGAVSGTIQGGAVTLSDTLDRVRITTVNGTDVFDAGSVNILYE